MSSPYMVHVAQTMREIDAAQWDACANPEADTSGLGISAPLPDGAQPANEAERFNPFITHAFLTALETSKSVGSSVGWISAHILVKDAGGRLAAAAPAYIKTPSTGG